MDNVVKLLSSDIELFEVEASVVQESKMLKTIMEDMGTEDAIRLETVCSKVLAQVIEYCQYHAALHTKSDGNPAIAENAQVIEYCSSLSCQYHIGFHRRFHGNPAIAENAQVIQYCQCEYCQDHAELHRKFDGNPAIAENPEVKKWNAKFINVDSQALVDLIQAASFLDIQSLLDLACQAVVDMMVDKSREEVCQVLNMRT